MTPLARAFRGVGRGVRARPGAFGAAFLAVLLLSVLLPPLVLSVARKPVDFFTFNPWLSKLPAYLGSDEFSWSRKAEAVWNLALFWFSSDSPFGGVEWGFAVDVGDLARILAISGLLGAYFALWSWLRQWRPARDASAVPALRAALRDGRPEIRAAAAALERISLPAR